MGDSIPYSVVLKNGRGKCLKRWIWVDRSKVEDVVRRFCGTRLDYGVSKLEVFDDKFSIVAEDEVSANVLAGLRGIPEPFVRKNGKYVLNRFGE